MTIKKRPGAVNAGPELRTSPPVDSLTSSSASDKTDLQVTFPSVPAAREALSRLRAEVKDAKTFKSLDMASRTAEAIQRAFKPVREVSHEAGKVWTAAVARLGEELAKVPRAKGGVPYQQRSTGSKSDPVGTGSKSDPAPTLAQLGVTKRQSAQANALNKIPEKLQKQYIAALEADDRDVTPTNIIKLHKEATREAKRAGYASRVASGGTVEDLVSLAESEQKFSVIYADPPWEFKVYSGKGKERSAERHYDTLSVKAICALPVAELAADDCALFLWGVWPEHPGVLEVIKRWGFTYKTAGFVWAKQNRNGEGWFTGMGYWTRANTEPCLFATKGSPTRLAMDVHQLIVAPVGKHSAKPEEARKRIERLLPGPYLELFARGPHAGWTTWGNEVRPEEEEMVEAFDEAAE